jgi:1,6-anhydro-N-acetylmuramate kinase
MTGTSIDGLDCALVHVEDSGLQMRASIVRGYSEPLGELSPALRAVARRQPHTAEELAGLALRLGMVHLEALKRLIGEDRIDLVAVHGQTVFHRPPISWQLINPAPIAYGLGVPVVFDLRAADLACGGEGAPITPLADWVLFRDGSERRAVVNLGGFANVTVLPAGGDDVRIALELIEGGDVCACNQLLDEISRRQWNQPYDYLGERAAAGRVDRAGCEELVALLRAQCEAERSLGTGDEVKQWIDAWQGRLAPEDLARSACAAIAHVVAHRVGDVQRLILAGGGVQNQALVAEIREQASGDVVVSDDLAVPAPQREAVAIAVLGALCQDRVPITLPRVTHCQAGAPVAGCWVLP